MKTALITGATQGIGFHTALRLLETGKYHVVLHARNADKGAQAIQKLSERGERVRTENLTLVTGDLSQLRQVASVAEQVKENFDGLDVLINNAGVFANEERQTSKDGYELTFAVNVLAPFALTKLLLPSMRENGHIINTSSLSASGTVPWDDLQLEKNYSNHRAYSLSKLLDMLFTFALHRKLLEAPYADLGLKTNTLDPGTVDTRMLQKGWQGLSGIPLDTADNTFKLVTDPASAKGKYYVDHRLCAPPQGARPRGDQDRLWDILEEECEKTLGN